MSDPQWAKSLYRKLHLDWHQPPWIRKPGAALNRKTAAQQARMFKQAGVEAVEFFVYNHHGQTYFPSKIGIRHPHFIGDYPGKMVRALHDEGLKAIGYMNVLTSIHLHRTKPDWFVQTTDGRHPRGAWLTYEHSWLCLSSPYIEEYFLPLVEEVLQRYPLDGLWLDALSWMYDPICHCPYCQIQFVSASGDAPPPARLDSLADCSAKERKRWFAWKTFRMGQVTALQLRLSRLTHRIRPGLVLMDNCAGQAIRPFCATQDGKFSRWCASRELTVDAFSCDPVPMGGNHEHLLSFHARHQITTGKPFDFMNERFHCWGEWQTRSVVDWKLEFATILANGGRCFFADNPYPDGRLEPQVYRRLTEAYAFVKEREHLCRESEPVFEIGILAAAPSMAFSLGQLHDKPECMPAPAPADRIMGAHLAAIELGWQTHIFDEATLIQTLPRLRCVIVPEQELLHDATVEALTAFVKRGGRLWLTGGCGRFDEKFRERKAWPFSSIAGVKFKGEWPAPVNYFSPTSAFAERGRDLEPLPVECWGRAIQYSAQGAKPLLDFVEPIPDVWKNGRRERKSFQHHTVTGACPPANKRSGTSVFIHRYGRGQVMTMAMDPFARYSVEGHRLLRGLLDAGLETLYPRTERLFSVVNKPLHVEVHLTHQRERFIVHAVNFFAQKRRGAMVTNDEVPLTQEFQIVVASPKKIQSALAQPGRRKIFLERVGRNRTIVTLPSFHLHSAAVLSAQTEINS